MNYNTYILSYPIPHQNLSPSFRISFLWLQLYAVLPKDHVMPVRYFAKDAASAPKGLKGDGRSYMS